MANKVYLDANVILDYLQDRPNGQYVEKIFLEAHSSKLQLITSVLNFAIIFYVERKRGFSRAEIYKSFGNINKIITVVEQSSKSYQLALKSEFKDFEDALQYFAAVENDADYLITENRKDYRTSIIPVYSSKVFVREVL